MFVGVIYAHMLEQQIIRGFKNVYNIYKKTGCRANRRRT